MQFFENFVDVPRSTDCNPTRTSVRVGLQSDQVMCEILGTAGKLPWSFDGKNVALKELNIGVLDRSRTPALNQDQVGHRLVLVISHVLSSNVYVFRFDV